MSEAASQSGFIEDRAAAQSQKNGWTRMASTAGLIRVAVDDQTLRVAPRSALARWLLQGLGLDLRHTIPLDRILSAEHEGNSGPYGKVMLHFRRAEGDDRALRLYLRGWQEFLGVLVGRGVAVRG